MLTASPNKLSLPGVSGEARRTNSAAHQNDNDVSLASVAKDLGFDDDMELSEILSTMPDGFSSIMSQDIG